MTQDQKDTRRDYDRDELRRNTLDVDPMRQFEQWLAQANAAQLVDATAMTLATVAADGQPSARIVLLKHFDAAGFVWYTDYSSQKGLELAQNPKATLLFYWRELERQVRMSGEVVKISVEESAKYFHSRPKDSQLSAAASAQSEVIADRAALERKVQALPTSDDDSIAMPVDWGGYRLTPHTYEFWQGRSNRLHDRFRYQRDGERWHIDRLQP